MFLTLLLLRLLLPLFLDVDTVGVSDEAIGAAAVSVEAIGENYDLLASLSMTFWSGQLINRCCCCLER